MKLIENSISDTLYERCCNELNELNDKPCWSSSRLIWGNVLKEGVTGSCLSTPVSDDLHNLLEEELKSTLPEYKKLICQYYLWQTQSGISWHNDKGNGRLFGATLHLNDGWEPNNGGWFIWEDKHGEHHATLPKKKSLVINDEYEFHCVTPVAFDFRCTIQIWGESYTQPQTRVVK